MLDTLTAADQLTAAGFESEQAKAIVSVIRDSESAGVTKSELDASLNQLKTRLEARFNSIEGQISSVEERFSVLVSKSELDARLRQLETKIESRLSRSALVQTIATVILVVALLKFL